MISIVGNAKNAGKTTVINHLIDGYFNRVIALTSIGLDGEEIDQVTFQEKPRIFAKRNFIIATAINTLEMFEAEYEIIEETDIFTSIGRVVIAKITKEGNVLVAGPSIISEMEKLISILEKYSPERIFIDGAFFRHSTARISQATVLVIGANLSADMDKVVNNARLAIKKFQLPLFDRFKGLDKVENICFIDEENNIIQMDFTSLLGNINKIFLSAKKNYKYLYFPKALTNDFVREMVVRRHEIHFDIIVNSPVNIQLDEKNLDNIFKIKSNVFVLESVNLIAICYNPTSTRGYTFDELDFRKKLSEITTLELFNVKKEV